MLFAIRSRSFRGPLGSNGLRLCIAAGTMVIGGLAISAEEVAPDTGITASGFAAPGRRAPDFLLQDLEYNFVRLSEFRGKPVVLNFFASWCSPCLRELPLIQDVYEQSLGEDFVILGVGYQDSRSAIESLAEDAGLSFPIVIDGDNSVGRAYRVIGPPYTFFIDANGLVVEVVAGPLEKEVLERNLDTLVRASPTDGH